MLFSKWITVPADTAETDPHEDTIKVCKGIVRRVWVLIPVPSAWCVGVQLWYATWQMWPTSRTEWIPGGMMMMEFEESLKVTDVPLSFIVKAYNEDTVNDHKIWVALSVLRPTITGELQRFFQLFES